MDKNEINQKMEELLSSTSNKDNFSEKSADLWAQMFNPKPTDSEDFEKTQNLLKEQLQVFQRTVKEGFDYFMARDHDGVAKNVIEKIGNFIQASMKNGSDALANPPQLNDEKFAKLFDIAIDACEDKEYIAGNAMMSALAGLFPNRIQPYIAIAKIAIEQQGMSVGLNIFDQLTSAIEDPLLYYYAAMAHAEDGTPSSLRKTEDLLKKGIEMCSDDLDSYADIQNKMQKLLLVVSA